MKTRHFENCSAPLCLEADDITDDMIWYSDEEICNANSKNGVPNWIKQQRKIAKKAKGKNIGFFTFKMLKRNCVIGSGIKGIDGDRYDVEDQVKRWFRGHKEKRVLTEKEKEILKKRLNKNFERR